MFLWLVFWSLAQAVPLQHGHGTHAGSSSSSLQTHAHSHAAKGTVGFRGVVSLPLRKATSPRAGAVLLSLQQRRRPHASISLLEEQNLPLHKEVLKEKQLVTYFADIVVGSTSFKVLLDTGSCEFWVPSSDCTTPRCLAHQRLALPPSAPAAYSLVSSAARGGKGGGFTNPFRLRGKAIGDETRMDIKYLSGEVSGPFVSLPVTLGAIQVPSQQVGVATTVNIVLLDSVSWDGIMGLAYPAPSLIEKGVRPIFDTLMAGQTLRALGLKDQFAYHINDQGGSFTLGGADCSVFGPGDCSPKFAFVPVSQKGYWTVRLQRVVAQWPGEAAPRVVCQGGCDAIVDSGTYLIYGPRSQIQTLFASPNPAAPEPSDFCSQVTVLPTLFFTFANGVSLSFKPIDYILQFQVTTQEHQCVSGISPDNDVIWTFGQVFLRSVYTLFDRGADRVGFAPLPHTTLNSISLLEQHDAPPAT